MGWNLVRQKRIKIGRGENGGSRLIIRRQTSKFSKRSQTTNNLFSLFSLPLLSVTFTASQPSSKTITLQNKIRPKLTPSLFCNFYRFPDVTTRLICFKAKDISPSPFFLNSIFFSIFTSESSRHKNLLTVTVTCPPSPRKRASRSFLPGKLYLRHRSHFLEIRSSFDTILL